MFYVFGKVNHTETFATHWNLRQFWVLLNLHELIESKWDKKKDDWGKWNWMLVSIAAGLMRPKWQQNTAKTRKRHIKYGKISAYMNSICFYRNDYSCIVNMRNFHSDPICYNEHEKKNRNEKYNIEKLVPNARRCHYIPLVYTVQYRTHKIKLDRTNANQSYWVYCIFFLFISLENYK